MRICSRWFSGASGEYVDTALYWCSLRADPRRNHTRALWDEEFADAAVAILDSRKVRVAFDCSSALLRSYHLIPKRWQRIARNCSEVILRSAPRPSVLAYHTLDTLFRVGLAEDAASSLVSSRREEFVAWNRGQVPRPPWLPS